MTSPDLLSTDQAAAVLGVNPRTVRRYAKAGKLPIACEDRGQLRFDPDVIQSAATNGLFNAAPSFGTPAPAPAAAPVDEGRAAAAGTGTPEWLLTSEAAGILRVSERWVREQAAMGLLPARRYGSRWRIHRSAVEGP